MASEAPKIVALSLAVAAAVGLAVVWLPRMLGAAGGSEVEVITLLKTRERDGLELAVAGGTLVSHSVAYQRITVTVDEAARRATVLATLDFTGTVGHTDVSSLGVEKIPFVSDGKEWRPEGSWAPRLVAAVNALERRRRGFEAADRPRLTRLAGVTDGGGLGDEAERWLGLADCRLRVDAWYLRLERDEATASEQYRIEGVSQDRPFRSAGPRKLHLQLSDGGEFFFPTGLM